MSAAPPRVTARNPGLGLQSVAGAKGIILGDFSEIRRCIAEQPFSLDRFSVVSDSWLGAHSGVGVHTFVNGTALGRFVSIGSRCSVGANGHELSQISTSFALDRAVERQSRMGYGPQPKELEDPRSHIGHDCWIGDNSVVLQGVSLAIGTVVGAGSVVTRNTDAYSIVVGNPARVIRTRFDESLCARLLESRWWEESIDLLRGLGEFAPEDALDELERRRVTTNLTSSGQ